MTVCKLLYGLYGRDTRAAQWLNLIASLVWFIVSLSVLLGSMKVSLPDALQVRALDVLMLNGFTLLFVCFGFGTNGRPHQLAKGVGLVLGALTQAVIANGYVSAYPPLDMMLVVSTVLSIWMFGAVFYVIQCEGINGTDNSAT